MTRMVTPTPVWFSEPVLRRLERDGVALLYEEAAGGLAVPAST
jgi:hypothetical protein